MIRSLSLLTALLAEFEQGASYRMPFLAPRPQLRGNRSRTCSTRIALIDWMPEEDSALCHSMLDGACK